MFGIFLASSLYWVANRYVDPYTLNDLLDGPLIIVSFTAAAYYLTWSLFNCHMLVDRAFMLRFGICMAWFGNGVWRVSRFLYAQGVLKGPIGAHDAWRGYMILLMTIAGVLHILAIDMESGSPTRSKMVVSLMSVALGVAVVLWAKM
jgi:hypothetical protein